MSCAARAAGAARSFWRRSEKTERWMRVAASTLMVFPSRSMMSRNRSSRSCWRVTMALRVCTHFCAMASSPLWWQAVIRLSQYRLEDRTALRASRQDRSPTIISSGLSARVSASLVASGSSLGSGSGTVGGGDFGAGAGFSAAGGRGVDGRPAERAALRWRQMLPASKSAGIPRLRHRWMSEGATPSWAACCRTETAVFTRCCSLCQTPVNAQGTNERLANCDG